MHLCHNLCSHFPIKKTQKEEGMEKKDKTGATVSSSFTNAPVAQVTDSYWASLGPFSATFPSGHLRLMLSARAR